MSFRARQLSFRVYFISQNMVWVLNGGSVAGMLFGQTSVGGYEEDWLKNDQKTLNEVSLGSRWLVGRS